jgi:hypothetical protein
VIGFRLVRVSPCEAGECPVSDVALAEEAGQHCGTGGAGVALCEQRAADPAVIHERGAIHAFHGNGALHISELADIVVAVVYRGPAGPLGVGPVASCNEHLGGRKAEWLS